MSLQTSKQNLCIVAILRDETRFLDEWIAYHRILGADHFLLYDDDPHLPLEEFLKPHRAYAESVRWYGKIPEDRNVSRQYEAYRDALGKLRGKFQWVLFLDGDEFVVFKKHQGFHDFLIEHQNADSISLSWRYFGHNGYYNDPKGLISKSLTRRQQAIGRKMKSISKLDSIIDIVDAHHCTLREGSQWIDSNGREFSEIPYPEKCEVAQINHYLCRSFKTWMARPTRGDVNYSDQNLSPKHWWRTKEEACLKYFVETICKSFNEEIDESLVCFESRIQQFIGSLDRADTISEHRL